MRLTNGSNQFLLLIGLVLSRSISFSQVVAPDQQETISVSQLASPLKGKALDLIKKAEKQLREHDTADAFETLRLSLNNDNARPYALCILGTEHLRLVWNDPSMLGIALEELEEGAALVPGDAGTRSNLALALLVKGDFGKGLQHAKKAVQLNPSQPKFRYVLGRLFAKLGQHEDANFHLKLAAAGGILR